MTTREYAIQCIKDEAEALLELIPQIDEQFDKAVEMIYQCKGKVIVTGVGKSGHIGAKMAATFSSTGTPSFFINPLDVYHGDLGVMTKDDVVVAISNSGQTDELLRFIPMVLHMQIPIIGMSGNPQSLLAKYSTCHININVRKEACPLNLAPTSSTTATLAMGDALAVALIEKRNGFGTPQGIHRDALGHHRPQGGIRCGGRHPRRRPQAGACCRRSSVGQHPHSG